MFNNVSTKKGVIYARVSSEEQKKSGYSLASQKRFLEEKMKNDGIEAFCDPIIDVESGRNFEREGLKKLMDLAKSGSINYLYVYDLDRLGRHVAETPYLMYKLKEETGVVVRTISDEYNFDDPIDSVLVTIKSLPGDVESRKLGERTQRGKIEKFRQGKWIGPSPFGCRKKANGELEKILELEPIVIDIFKTYEKCLSIKGTTCIINRKYTDKIGRFSSNQIRRILTNQVYIGKPKYGDIEIALPTLSMIDPELYNKVQRFIKMKSRKSRRRKTSKLKSVLDDFAEEKGTDYLLRVLDILKPFCPKCQTQMVGNGSDTIAGFRVRKFICPACRYQRRIPSAKELERLQSDSLSCPNCKAVENFYVKSKLDGCKEYACRRCGFSFHIRPNTQYPKLEQKNCINRKKENVKNPPFWTESLSGSNIEKRESSKILKQKTSGLLDKFLREGD